MKPSIWPRELVARNLTVSTSTLIRWEDRGLVKASRDGDLEGYGPAEVRRLWTILTFHRDLGINLAGIEVILRLRDEMAATRLRLDQLAKALESTIDGPAGPDVHG